MEPVAYPVRGVAHGGLHRSHFVCAHMRLSAVMFSVEYDYWPQGYDVFLGSPMANDADAPVLPDEKLLSRRPWYLIGVLILLLSLLLRQPLLVVAGYLVIVLGAVPELWYRFCLSGVTVQRTVSARRAQIGDEIVLTLTVENCKFLPLPRLRIEDEVPEEGTPIRGAYLETSVKPLRLLLINTLSLWAFQRVTRRYRLRCVARGLYTFGPLRLESGDPFGLLTREEQREHVTERLLVYPLVVPLERLGLPARAPFGDRMAPHALLEDPLRIIGVRDYVTGDDPRRIHWKATARMGRLQSKVLKPSTHHTLILFVDARTYDNPVLGYDPDLLELALCAAASVTTWGIEHGYAVGLFANGTLGEGDLPKPTVAGHAGAHALAASAEVVITGANVARSPTLHLRLPPSAAREQVVYAQELLARLIPYFPAPISQVIARETPHLPFGSTIVYTGAAPALGAEGLALLHRLRARGHSVAMLLTGDGPIETSGLPTTRIGSNATWKHLLDEALATHGIDRRGRSLPAAADTAPHDSIGLKLEEVRP